MRGRFFAVVLLSLPFVTALACADDEQSQGFGESPSTAVEGITGSCTALTIGMVCDPDGAGTAAQECQGVCQLNSAGAPTCVRLAQPSSVNGAVCGGTGSDCSRTCLNGACSNTPAAFPVACRPTAPGSHACQGVCAMVQGSRQCVNLANAAPGALCAFGRTGGGSGCQFQGCNRLSALDSSYLHAASPVRPAHVTSAFPLLDEEGY